MKAMTEVETKKREKRGSEGVVSFDCFEQADGEAERRWRERGGMKRRLNEVRKQRGRQETVGVYVCMSVK